VSFQTEKLGGNTLGLLESQRYAKTYSAPSDVQQTSFIYITTVSTYPALWSFILLL